MKHRFVSIDVEISGTHSDLVIQSIKEDLQVKPFVKAYSVRPMCSCGREVQKK